MYLDFQRPPFQGLQTPSHAAPSLQAKEVAYTTSGEAICSLGILARNLRTLNAERGAHPGCFVNKSASNSWYLNGGKLRYGKELGWSVAFIFRLLWRWSWSRRKVAYISCSARSQPTKKAEENRLRKSDHSWVGKLCDMPIHFHFSSISSIFLLSSSCLLEGTKVGRRWS